MSMPTLEIAVIRLAAGRTEAELIAASNAFQQFLAEQPGYLCRDLVRASDGTYADVVRWASRKEADAVADKVSSSVACQTYFSLMEWNPDNPAEGVSHFDILAVYGR
jgi:hypothetical protein